MEDINNEIVQGINIIPSKIHEKEKEYLNPLPLWDRLINYYEPDKTYKVSKESMITYKGKKYSVPTYLIGKLVTISESDSRINIYYNITDFVCQHEISDKYLNYHESNLKEIMKSEAYRNKTDEEIQEIIELKKKMIMNCNYLLIPPKLELIDEATFALCSLHSSTQLKP